MDADQPRSHARRSRRAIDARRDGRGAGRSQRQARRDLHHRAVAAARADGVGRHRRRIHPGHDRRWRELAERDATGDDGVEPRHDDGRVALRRRTRRTRASTGISSRTSIRTSIARATWARAGRRSRMVCRPASTCTASRKTPSGKACSSAGTERGVYLSLDDGDNWQPLQLNLPVTSMRDFEIHDDDLIVGTHGRGIWVIDDISALRQLSDAVLDADAYLFKPADAYQYTPGRRQRHAAAEGRAAGAEPAERRRHRLLPEVGGDRSGHAQKRGAAGRGWRGGRTRRGATTGLRRCGRWRARLRRRRWWRTRRGGRHPQHVSLVAPGARALRDGGRHAPRELESRWRRRSRRTRRTWRRRGGGAGGTVHGEAHRQRPELHADVRREARPADEIASA